MVAMFLGKSYLHVLSSVLLLSHVSPQIQFVGAVNLHCSHGLLLFIVAFCLLEIVAKPFHLAPVFLGRSAGAAVAHRHLRDDFLGPLRGVVDVAP